MDNKINNWLPLESNSDVINEYIKTLGASDILKYYDVVSLDIEDLLFIPQPVLAALFTYPCTKEIKEYLKIKEQGFKDQQQSKDIYYMKQTAKNACGTVGILHALLNLVQQFPFMFTEDSFVTKFFNETKEISPLERANHLTLNKTLQTLHTQAVHKGSTKVDDQMKVDHHFIAYVLKDGDIYELDGAQSGPINWGPCEQDMFIQKVSSIVLTEYIQRSVGNIGFNLMALCMDQN